ncbi:MAG: hypothetical protein V3W18_05970 [candidate division Zixibacteria bacterium]
MSELDNNDENQNCCGPGECCSDTDPNKNKGFKSIAFTAIIVLAVGVTTYSLFFKSADAGKAACDPVAIIAPLENLTAIPELDNLLGDLDFALIVISGSDIETPGEIPNILDSALSEIKLKTEKAGVINLLPGDSGYDKVIEEYTITGFPAVLALGRYGHRLLIRSGITIETLILAHKISASAPAPCC